MADVTCASPIEAPPPAYEVAQLNFEEKISVAAERSLDLSDSRRDGEQDAPEKSSDEISDDARKSDASKRSESDHPRSSIQGNERRPTVRPLNFRRRTRNAGGSSASANEKERPSWFDEARLAASTLSNSGASSRPLPVPGETRPDLDSRSHRHQALLSDDYEEDRSVPPPPFAAIDASLDVQYASNNAFRRRPGGTIVLRYSGDDFSGSPPPSPPHSPPAHRSSQRSHYRHRSGSPQINAPRNLLPRAHQQSGLQVPAPLVRPRSAEPRPHISAPPPPRLSFNPSIAYEGTRSSTLSRQFSADTEETAHDVTALYSPAVAPLLSSQKPRPAPSKVRRYTPSVSSLPEYDQQEQNTQGRKSVYSMLDYAESSASVYTQSSLHIPQYPQVAQYPQTAQYPTQQNFNRPTSVVQQNGSAHTAYRPHSQSYPR